MVSRPIIENVRFLEKKTWFCPAPSTGHLGGPDDSQSMGNRLLTCAGDISGINLPDRVQLVTKFKHFATRSHINPVKTGIHVPC